MCRRLFNSVAALLTMLSAPGAMAADAQEGQGVDGGLSLRWTYTPNKVHDGLGTLDVFVSDAASGAPLQYERGALLGWMQRDRGALVEQEKSCADRIKTLATQGIGRRSDIDLNQYRIVTLNSDGSLAFINPFVGFNNAKLESIIDLQARPLDWAQARTRMEMWVLLSSDRLVAVDLQSAAITRSIDLPQGSLSRRIILDESAGMLWLALPATGQLASLNLNDERAGLIFTDAPGVTDILATDDGKVVAWLNGDNIARLITGENPDREVTLPAAASAIVHSDQAKATIIVSTDGTLTLVPDGTPSERQHSSIVLPHAVATMRLIDHGRRLVAVGGGRASIIDLARNRVVMELATPPGADSIVTTDQFLYVTGGPSGRAALFGLDDLIHSKNQALDVMVSSPNRALDDGDVPSRIVASPQGNGILVASAGDGMIYQYSEGMMAPVGSYSNYRRAAVGLDIVDYSFSPVEPGHYRTTIRNDSAGRYELLIGAVRPRLASCSALILEGSTNNQAASARLQAQYISAEATASRREKVRVRVLETLPGREATALSGLRDLTLLVFDKHSGWQRRIPLSDEGDGEYEAVFPLPKAATYDLLVSSQSANLSFVEGHMGEQRLGLTP